MLFDTRPKVSVRIDTTGETYPCALDESLLQGMLKLGRRGIPVGCVNGGCGVCKVQIVEGQVRTLGPVSRAHVSAEEEACGITLACRVAPLTPLRLQALGKLAKPLAKGFTKGFATTANDGSTLQAQHTQGDS